MAAYEQAELDHYGADRARTLGRDLNGSTVQTRTHYVGSVEVIYTGHNPATGSDEFRRYITGVAIATYFEASGVERQRYLHKDQLGSTTAITDENDLIETQMAFDPWGGARIRGLALLRLRFDPTRRLRPPCIVTLCALA